MSNTAFLIGLSILLGPLCIAIAYEWSPRIRRQLARRQWSQRMRFSLRGDSACRGSYLHGQACGKEGRR